MLSKGVLLFLFTVSLHAQIYVVFSDTGKRNGDAERYRVSLCNAGSLPQTYSPFELSSAASAFGFTRVNPEDTASSWEKAAVAYKVISGTYTTLVALGVIQFRDDEIVKKGLPGAIGGALELIYRLWPRKHQAPDYTGPVEVAAGGCNEYSVYGVPREKE